jgi:glycosyltransferase involved in cell wall biosynthesis
MLTRDHTKLVREADTARDEGQWQKAADLYEKFLTHAPNEWKIWVQLGHMRKEAGRLDDAETAYLTAQKIAPEDSDLALQLGHLMKLKRLGVQATQYYLKALQLDANNQEAFRELVEAGYENRAYALIRAGRRATSTIYIDVSDLLSYLHQHTRVTGIQRVQIQLINAFQAAGYPFVYTAIDQSGIVQELDTDRLNSLIESISLTDLRLEDLRQIVDGVKKSARPLDLSAPGVYVILGAFWIVPSIQRSMKRLKLQGWKIAAYIYDIIPIRHPEFCDGNVVRLFSNAFMSLCPLLDLIITISEYTRIEVTKLLESNSLTIPVVAVPLAHGMPPTNQQEISEAELWLKNNDLDQPFVLCVGTIEIRKNHAMLFSIWQRFVQERLDPPLLVLVGRKGWRVNDLLDQLAVSDFLDGKIRILEGISDNELSALYRRCSFTIFPSFSEGWGLPVGESLSHKKLCLASKTSSIPEVGGDLVKYFDPLNAFEAKSLIEHYWDNPSELNKEQARISTEFHPRTWEQVAQTFQSKLLTLEPNPEGDHRLASAPTLSPGTIYQVGAGKSIRSHLSEISQRRVTLSLDPNDWYPVEDFGAWANKARARVDFKVPGTNVSGRDVIVYVRVAAPLNRPDISFQIASSPRPSLPFRRQSTLDLISAKCRTDAAGLLSFWVHADAGDSEVPADDNNRPVHAGLIELAYVFADATSDRLDMIERILLGRSN